MFYRETKEECGLDVSTANLDKVGVLTFEFVNEPQILEVHVFRATRYSGDVTESEGVFCYDQYFLENNYPVFVEMRPQWFGYSEVPYDDMWPDDRLWYPMMFDNKYFDGHFKFEGMSNILEHSITERAPGNH